MSNTEKDELTHRLYIRYEMRYYRGGNQLDAAPDEAQARIETGLLAIAHAGAIFDLLGLLSAETISRFVEAYPASADAVFENLSQLGSLVCEEAYGRIMEVPYVLKKREAERE